MSDPYAKLEELGLKLPTVSPPLAAYVPAVRSGNHVYVSGQLPMVDGKLLATGKVGAEISPEQAKELAARCALNGLAALESLVGLGKVALKRATDYAKSRIVFNRPIGMNQGIQHPLAKNWMELEAAWLMVLRAGWQYDQGLPCGPAANAAKYLAAEAGFQACEQAVMTHGGFGYAKEYHVERYLRESLIPRIAPISPQLILSFIAEKVLGLPKSY